jgi:hypothetical protein
LSLPRTWLDLTSDLTWPRVSLTHTHTQTHAHTHKDKARQVDTAVIRKVWLWGKNSHRLQNKSSTEVLAWMLQGDNQSIKINFLFMQRHGNFCLLYHCQWNSITQKSCSWTSRWIKFVLTLQLVTFMFLNFIAFTC